VHSRFGKPKLPGGFLIGFTYTNDIVSQRLAADTTFPVHNTFFATRDIDLREERLTISVRSDGVKYWDSSAAFILWKAIKPLRQF
jgi:hypothetical protein